MWIGIEIALFVVGLAALIWGADKLVNGASHLAHLLGVHPILIGMTILSIGTSIPEIATSITSNIAGHADVMMGNIIGSDLVQITLILGIVVLINPIKGKRKEIIFYGITMIFAVLLALYVMKDGYVDWADGALLIIAYALFLAHIIGNEHIQNHHFKRKHTKEWHHLIAVMIFGAVLTIVGCQVMVNSTINIAKWAGAPEYFIDFFLVGLGTSLPELIVSGIAAWKGNFGVSIGNLLGSNVTDPTLSFGLGLLFAKSAPVAAAASLSIIYLLIVSAIVIALFAWKKRLGRWAGAFLILLYVLSFFIR